MSGSAEPSGVRIGDSERDRAISALADHLAAGRLELDEYQDRLDAASSARTQTDLDRLFADLPDAGRTPAVRPTAEIEPRGRHEMAHRLVAASGGLALIGFFVCGFAIPGGWAWSWVFFLLPGVLRTLAGPGHHHDGE